MQGKSQYLIQESDLGRHTCEVPGLGRRSMQEVHDVYTFYVKGWSRRAMREAMDLTPEELEAMIERVILWKAGEPLRSLEDPTRIANPPYVSITYLPTPEEIEYVKWNVQYTGFMFKNGPNAKPVFRKPWSDAIRENHTELKVDPVIFQTSGATKHRNGDTLVCQHF